MGSHPEINLQGAVDRLTEAPLHSSLFDDAYKHLAKATTSLVSAVEHHQCIAIGSAVAGAALLIYASRGESIVAAESTIEKGGTTLLAPGEKLAAQAGERQAVLKQVGVIPDVERPMLDAAAQNAVPEYFSKAANEYGLSLGKVKEFAPTYTARAGQDISAVAKDVLEQRAPITGERVTAESIADEAKRLTARNPELELKEGANVILYADNDLKKLAEKTQFKHVPQIGQFLKEKGVTEEQIGRALAIQKAEPQASKRLIGQILTDDGLATKEQVDAAFAKQGQLKGLLAEVRKEAGF
jgi:hypothetical protein